MHVNFIVIVQSTVCHRNPYVTISQRQIHKKARRPGVPLIEQTPYSNMWDLLQ